MPRPGPTSTAARSTRSSRCGATRSATGVLAAACAARGIGPADRSRPTRSSTATRLDGDGHTLPTDPRLARQPVRRVQGRGRAARGRRPSRQRPGAGARDRPDGLAVRRARAATSRAGSSTPPSEPGPPASRSASSADEWGTPTYTADVAEAIVELLAEDAMAGHPPPRQRAVRDPGATGRATSSAGPASMSRSSTSRSSTWERPSRPPRWGVLAQTPLPSGEPLRSWPDAMADYAPAPPARDAGPGMTRDARAAAVRHRPARRRLRLDRPPRRRARLVPRAVAGGPASRARTFVQANLSTSAAGRPPRPPSPSPPGRPVDRRGRPGASSPSSTSGRCSTGRARAARRDPRAGAPTSGSRSRPASPTASSRSTRSS